MRHWHYDKYADLLKSHDIVSYHVYEPLISMGFKARIKFRNALFRRELYVYFGYANGEEGRMHFDSSEYDALLSILAHLYTNKDIS